MDVGLAVLLATFLSFLTTFGTMYAVYHWPPGHTEAGDRIAEERARRNRNDRSDYRPEGDLDEPG